MKSKEPTGRQLAGYGVHGVDKKRKTMEERRGTMDRRKFTATLVALAAGIALSAGSALAQTGYLMGDAAPNKLVPFYRVGPTLATIIGIENVEESEGPNDSGGEDIAVHVTIWTKRSSHVANFDLCLSPFDFGFIVLQQNPANAAQQAELAARGAKVRYYSVSGDNIPSEGYVTLQAVAEFDSTNGKCTGNVDPVDPNEGLATWAILADVGNGFFAAEIPTPTTNAGAKGGAGAFGLIPGPGLDSFGCGNPFDEFPCVLPASVTGSSTVIARFDVNAAVDSTTEIFVWLRRNAFTVPNDPGAGVNRSGASLTAFLDCEDELELSTTIFLPDEVNVLTWDSRNPATFPASLSQCVAFGQNRGVLRFKMPDTGFLWSQITQESDHFRQTYLGYNLGDNDFIDCADGFNDFSDDCDTDLTCIDDEAQSSGPRLCGD
jgi:hypothetical protein